MSEADRLEHLELLRALTGAGVEFVVIGGYAANSWDGVDAAAERV
jgi:hypothetical protein